MRVGIVGAGGIGQTVGRTLGEAGHEVLVSWSSSDAHLHEAAARIGFGARAVTPEEAVKDADVVVFSPRWEHIDAASEAAGSLAGKLVIDTNNPYNPARDGYVDLGEQTAAQYVSARLPGARYVKGFSTLPTEVLAGASGRTGPDKLVGFLSGDDADAKASAAGLIRAAGLEPVDLGAIADSASMDPGGEYFGRELHLTDIPGLPRL